MDDAMAAVPTSEDRRAAADALLVELGAGGIDHPGGDLLVHLRRTADQLAAWGADDDLVLTGLCHALYGTDGFPVPLLGLDERPRLREVVGAVAELDVYRYDACARRTTYARFGESPLVLDDRFDGSSIVLTDREATGFATLTIANELDLVREDFFDDATVAEIAELFRGLSRYAPEASRAAVAEIEARG
jgi:hypothetical protein